MHDFNWSWVFSSPHISGDRRGFLCSQTLSPVFVSVLLNMSIVKLPRELVLLNTVLDVFCFCTRSVNGQSY